MYLPHLAAVVCVQKTSYNWYVPKGLLKRNWIDKYLSRVPALVVVFVNLDWNDPHYGDR